jgi:hypothetical protein
LGSEVLSACFELALDNPELGENAVPFGLQAPDLIGRQFADTANGGGALQYVHRLARKIAQNIKIVQNVLGLLQEMSADLRELPLLLRRNDGFGLVQTIGNEVVQLFPVIELECKQTEFRLELFVPHVGSNTDEFERLIELLQIVDQEMRPRPVDRLFLADDSLFEIESALSPAKDFSYGMLAL